MGAVLIDEVESGVPFQEQQARTDLADQAQRRQPRGHDRRGIVPEPWRLGERRFGVTGQGRRAGERLPAQSQWAATERIPDQLRHRRGDLSFVPQPDFELGGMDVDVDPPRIDLDGQEEHRVAAAWQQRAVGRLQRRLQTAAVDRPSIHEQGHPATTGTSDFGARDRPVDRGSRRPRPVPARRATRRARGRESRRASTGDRPIRRSAARAGLRRGGRSGRRARPAPTGARSPRSGSSRRGRPCR